MQHDLHLLAQQLLESLANSIHDRKPDDTTFCFNVAEVRIVEEWIGSILLADKKRPAMD
jgi:hypothetical protein